MIGQHLLYPPVPLREERRPPHRGPAGEHVTVVPAEPDGGNRLSDASTSGRPECTHRPPLGVISCAPATAIGTIGTWASMARMAAPFLNGRSLSVGAAGALGEEEDARSGCGPAPTAASMRLAVALAPPCARQGCCPSPSAPRRRSGIRNSSFLATKRMCLGQPGEDERRVEVRLVVADEARSSRRAGSRGRARPRARRPRRAPRCTRGG